MTGPDSGWVDSTSALQILHSVNMLSVNRGIYFSSEGYFLCGKYIPLLSHKCSIRHVTGFEYTFNIYIPVLRIIRITGQQKGIQ